MDVRGWLGLLALLLAAALIWQLRWVMLIVFGAVVLAVALDVPLAAILRRSRLGRPQALAVVLLLVLLLGGLVGGQLLPELLLQAEELGQLLPRVLSTLQDLAARQPFLQEIDPDLLQRFTWDQIEPLGWQLLGFAGGAANTVVQLLLVVLLAVLLALDPAAHQAIVLAATPRPLRHEARLLLGQWRQALGGWLAGMTLSSVVVFLLTWAGLALLGIPLALLSGLLCGLLTFVPILGPSVATLLPLAMALLISPARMLQVLLFRLVLQNLEAFLLTPLLLRRTVNLLPTVALTAQLSLGALLGLPGVLLALPLAVVVQVAAQRILVEQIMNPWR
jgi:predicted PurR-regulated permease PerM